MPRCCNIIAERSILMASHPCPASQCLCGPCARPSQERHSKGLVAAPRQSHKPPAERNKNRCKHFRPSHDNALPPPQENQKPTSARLSHAAVTHFLTFSSAALPAGRPLARGTVASIHCQITRSTVISRGLRGLRRMEIPVRRNPVFRAPALALSAVSRRDRLHATALFQHEGDS